MEPESIFNRKAMIINLQYQSALIEPLVWELAENMLQQI